MVREFARQQHGRHALALLERQDIDDVRAARRAPGLRNEVALLAVDAARVREEQNIVVRRGDEEVLDVILLLQALAGDAAAAAPLRAVGIDGQALDIARVREGIAAVLFFNEVLDVDLVLDVLNFRAALVAVLIADGGQLVLEDGLDKAHIAEHALVIGDAVLQLLIFVLEFFAVEALQGLQAHVEDGLGLNVIEAEALHEVFLCVVVARADDADDLVDVVLRDEQALEQVSALLCLAQVIARAAEDDLLLIGQIFIQNLAQGEDLRLALVLHEGQHIDGERRLQLRLSEQAVQDDLRVCLALELDDDAHTGAVGFVADVGDALKALLVDLIGHILDEHALVDLIGDLRDDDALTVLAEFLQLGAGAHGHAAAAGGIGGADTGTAEDEAARRKIRAGEVFHKVGERGLGVIEDAQAGVDGLGEVVGRDIRCHADGDAARAVHEQVREAAGEHARLLARFVEVRVPVHGVLFEVTEHFIRDFREAGLGVTVGSGGIAVDGAEVAVAVDEHIAHGEVLRQTHERIIDRRVAVRMIAAQHVADAGRGLFERLVSRQIILIHGIENAAVHGLEAVAHVRQRAADNDRHGILHVAGFHFMHQLGGHDRLIRESDVLRLVVLFMMCQGFSSLIWFAAYLKGFLLCYCGEQSAHGSPSGRAVTEGD